MLRPTKIITPKPMVSQSLRREDIDFAPRKVHTTEFHPPSKQAPQHHHITVDHDQNKIKVQLPQSQQPFMSDKFQVDLSPAQRAAHKAARKAKQKALMMKAKQIIKKPPQPPQ